MGGAFPHAGISVTPLTARQGGELRPAPAGVENLPSPAEAGKKESRSLLGRLRFRLKMLTAFGFSGPGFYPGVDAVPVRGGQIRSAVLDIVLSKVLAIFTNLRRTISFEFRLHPFHPSCFSLIDSNHSSTI